MSQLESRLDEFESGLHTTIGEAIVNKLEPVDLNTLIKSEGENLGELGLYIHIPFCSEICSFCAFHREIGGQAQRDNYVVSLKEHIMDTLSNFSPTQRIRSLYIGGGTPSLLTVEQTQEILTTVSNYVDISQASISFELHPENVTADYIKSLQALGITRFSIGIQNLSEPERTVLGRTLTTGAVDQERLKVLNDLGVRYNLDLMFGTPTQTPTSWMETIAQIIENIHPLEITLYQYVNAYGSDTRKKIASRGMEMPGLKSRHAMYNLAQKYLVEHGYHQTGTLSFASSNGAPEKNLLNNATNFLGLGPRTYSKIGSTFFTNDARTHDFRQGGNMSDYYGIKIPTWANDVVRGAFALISRRRSDHDDERLSRWGSWKSEVITQIYGVLYFVLNQPRFSRREMVRKSR